MHEVEKSIDRKHKAIKIQDRETLFDAAILLWSETQQGKPSLWHLSQHREAVLYSPTVTAKKIFLLSKEQGKYYCN